MYVWDLTLWICKPFSYIQIHIVPVTFIDLIDLIRDKNKWNTSAHSLIHDLGLSGCHAVRDLHRSGSSAVRSRVWKQQPVFVTHPGLHLSASSSLSLNGPWQDSFWEGGVSCDTASPGQLPAFCCQSRLLFSGMGSYRLTVRRVRL